MTAPYSCTPAQTTLQEDSVLQIDAQPIEELMQETLQIIQLL